MHLIGPASTNAAVPFALRDSRTAYDWDAVDARVRRAAVSMRQGMAGGEGRIAVFARNAAEPVLAYLAGLRAGISPVPVNFHLTVDECAYILRDSDARILFVGPETAQTGLAAAALSDVHSVVGWRCEGMPGVIDFDDWMANADADLPMDMPARPYHHYTSGTTGRPKGAETPPAMFPQVDTVGQLFAAYRAAVDALPSGPSLIIGPIYHTGPLNSVRHLAGGKPLVVLERFDPVQTLETIARDGISTVTMVPTHFQRLLALPDAERARFDVSSTRAVSHTGAACPPEVKRAMIDWFGPVLVESYGATESGVVAAIASTEWLERPGSVGRAQPGFETWVMDDAGKRLPAGATGQLFFRDKSGRGIVYHNDPEKTRAAHIAPGVFTLGDIGHVDDAGYIFITDRQSDMIVSGGVNIYPAEIEAVLATHPAIADSAVIGVPNAEMGEEVKALVVLRPDAAILPESLAAYLRERLASYKLPRSIDFVPDVGRNAMGKINKKMLRAPFWPTGRTIGG